MQRGQRAMVFLRCSARTRNTRRPPKQNHRRRLLEGHRLSGLRLLLRQQGHRTEKDHGLLHGQSPHRNQNQMEDERVQSNRRFSQGFPPEIMPNKHSIEDFSLFFNCFFFSFFFNFVCAVEARI